MYQRCPICKGKGLLRGESCPTCSGERIINKESGLPPSKYWTNPIYVPSYPIYPTYPTYPWSPNYPIITYQGTTDSQVSFTNIN